MKNKISLRITHPIVTPEEITRNLELTPEFSQTKGQQKTKLDGTLRDGFYKDNYWCYSHPTTKEYLSELVQDLNKHLFKKSTYLKYITETGGEIEYFMGCFVDSSHGEEFDWLLLKECADMRIKLSFDIYSNCNSDGTVNNSV